MNAGSSSTTISLEPLSTAASKRQTSFTLAFPSRPSIPWLAPRLRTHESILIHLRAVTICCAFATVCACLAADWKNATMGYYLPTLTWLIVVPSMCNLFWDAANTVVCYARHGYGMPPKAQIGCDFVLLLGNIACTTMFFVVSFPGLTLDDSFFNFATGSELAWVITVGVAAAIVFIARVVFFVQACRDRIREVKFNRPRRMYVPSTGAVVYLVSKSRKRGGAVEATSDTVPIVTRRSYERSAAETPTRHVTVGDLLAPEPAMKKKGTMSPPPEDYMPDEAELARRMRGDAQPQLILPGDVAPKFSSNIMGAASGGSYAVEGKMLVWPKRDDPLADGIVTGPRRRSL